jgi:hypothetical protein
MQQLSRNTLDIAWDRLGLKPGDTIRLRERTDDIWYTFKVREVSPGGLLLERVPSPRHDGSTSFFGASNLTNLEVRVVQCSS